MCTGSLQRLVSSQSAEGKWLWSAPPYTSLSRPARLKEHDGSEGGKSVRTRGQEDEKESCETLASRPNTVAAFRSSAVVPAGQALDIPAGSRVDTSTQSLS